MSRNLERAKPQERSYLDANWLWIMPVLATVIFVGGSVAIEAFGVLSWSVPRWLLFVGIVIGGLIAGVGAMFTDTLSAGIVRAFALITMIAVLIDQFVSFIVS